MKGSWKTSIVGWVLVAAGVLGLVGDTISRQGLPNTLPEWFGFGTAIAAGIGSLLAKDFDVSNSKDPAAPSVVQPAAAATVNPAAAVQ